MPSSHNNHQQTSFLANDLCDADSISPLVASEEKLIIRERCPGNHINMIDCHCNDVQCYIDEVGLNLATKDIFSPSIRITEPIAVVPRDCFDNAPDSIVGDIVGIRIGDILSCRPRLHRGIKRINQNVRVDLSVLKKPVFQGKQIVLIATDIDVVLETLWYKRYNIDLFQEIANAGFYAVTGMNFSLFLHECPLGQLINLNKSLAFCEELSKLGVAVIPHFYAVNESQRAKIIEFLVDRPYIQTVLINTQLQKDHASTHEVKLTVDAMLKHTDVNIILNGRQLKNPVYALTGRIIPAHQHNLKRTTIIKRSIERQKKRIRELLIRRRSTTVTTTPL